MAVNPVADLAVDVSNVRAGEAFALMSGKAGLEFGRAHFVNNPDMSLANTNDFTAKPTLGM